MRRLRGQTRSVLVLTRLGEWGRSHGTKGGICGCLEVWMPLISSDSSKRNKIWLPNLEAWILKCAYLANRLNIPTLQLQDYK